MKAISTLISLAVLFASVSADVEIDMGTAADFAVIVVGGLVNTGASGPIVGSVATTGHNVTGFAPGAITGTVEERNAVADQAHADATAVHNQLHALVGTQVVATADGTITVTKGMGDADGMGTTNFTGAVFTPGIYNVFSIITVITNITLSGEGQFIFTSGSHFRMNPGASIILTDGATVDNVFWATGDSTTIGAGGVLLGKVFTNSAITLNAGASAVGGLYSLSHGVFSDSPVTLV